MQREQRRLARLVLLGGGRMVAARRAPQRPAAQDGKDKPQMSCWLPPARADRAKRLPILKQRRRRAGDGRRSRRNTQWRCGERRRQRQRLDYRDPAARDASRSLYNGMLAFINHNIMPLSMTHVAACEGLIMATSILYILRQGNLRGGSSGLPLPACSRLSSPLYVKRAQQAAVHRPLPQRADHLLLYGLGGWCNERTLKLASV